IGCYSTGIVSSLSKTVGSLLDRQQLVSDLSLCSPLIASAPKSSFYLVAVKLWIDGRFGLVDCHQQVFQVGFASQHLFNQDDQFSFVALCQDRIYILLLEKLLRLCYPCQQQGHNMFAVATYRAGAIGVCNACVVERNLYTVNRGART